MANYTIIGLLDREGFMKRLEKRDDEEAVAYAEGYIDRFIELAPEQHVGSKFEVHEDDGSGIFSERTRAGHAVVEHRDGSFRQAWQVQRRRWRHSLRDMTVGDPFDATDKEPRADPGPVRMRAPGRS